MRAVVFRRKFKRDLHRCLSRGLKAERLQEIIDLLCRDQSLPPSCRPHKLVGQYQGLWECHISPDWLLIYAYDDDENSLELIRTGTHSDLF